MAERWFFALWPDPATAKVLAARARPLIPPGARAAHPLDLHLTLRFLGELSPDALRAAQSVGAGVRAAPLSLSLDQAGCFPRAAVLWCGPTRAPEALLALVTQLEQGLASQGFVPETRPYRPHLTLARRFHGRAARDWGPAVTWEARELVLAHGCPGQLPRYVAARRWPLAVAPRESDCPQMNAKNANKIKLLTSAPSPPPG
ncbi:RNA 2',3'-cyclic phosphodiesterase [uncultured Thiodictyon sp.]|uniref:RNA 2',3'-cyclic phosphodiesterase n=1 Tax=uncultured Thiodictyon sp. TaxID=1846217 RepID=UPI0025F597CF|nr:RNA 2',3'-cyclic phosphodiesterase [uncultured Thiodictyon sp.]